MKRHNEPTTVGLSRDGHDRLKELQGSGEFEEMADAYRFAIALALYRNADPGTSREGSDWTTIFNVGSLDADGSLFTAVEALRNRDLDEPVWKTAERLAAWGVDELHRLLQQKGKLPLSELLQEAAERAS